MDVQKFVSVAYKTEKKKSTGNWADSHTASLQWPLSTATRPQGKKHCASIREMWVKN